MVGEGKDFQAGAEDSVRLFFSLLYPQGLAYCLAHGKHSKLSKEINERWNRICEG